MRVWQSHRPGASHRILHNAGRSGTALARNGSQAGSHLTQNSPQKPRLRVRVRSVGDHYVDCTALATKYQRQEHSLSITGYVLLSLQCQKTFFLYRGIDHTTFADELVQTESERRSACFWM